jgi:hypothetical protein
MQHKVTRAAPGNGRHVDYTVVFDTSNITEKTVARIKQEADALLEDREIHHTQREVRLFAQNHKTVAIVHYEGAYWPHQKAEADADFEEFLPQLLAILDVYDTPRA